MNEYITVEQMDGQRDRLLQYLKDNPGGLDRFQAWEILGIANVTGRISELRNSGFPIVSIRTPKVNRYGETTYIATYKLLVRF